MRFQICPSCGSHLDHGERCECRDTDTADLLSNILDRISRLTVPELRSLIEEADRMDKKGPALQPSQARH